MQWFVINWFWILIGVAFVAMHLFGHGGHGRHGGLRPDVGIRGDLLRPDLDVDPTEETESNARTTPGDHHH
jgi:hypothetical protein